jgi:hypothetical protein
MLLLACMQCCGAICGAVAHACDSFLRKRYAAEISGEILHDLSKFWPYL